MHVSPGHRHEITSIDYDEQKKNFLVGTRGAELIEISVETNEKVNTIT